MSIEDKKKHKEEQKRIQKLRERENKQYKEDKAKAILQRDAEKRAAILTTDTRITKINIWDAYKIRRKARHVEVPNEGVGLVAGSTKLVRAGSPTLLLRNNPVTDKGLAAAEGFSEVADDIVFKSGQFSSPVRYLESETLSANDPRLDIYIKSMTSGGKITATGERTINEKGLIVLLNSFDSYEFKQKNELYNKLMTNGYYVGEYVQFTTAKIPNARDFQLASNSTIPIYPLTEPGLGNRRLAITDDRERSPRFDRDRARRQDELDVDASSVLPRDPRLRVKLDNESMMDAEEIELLEKAMSELSGTTKKSSNVDMVDFGNNWRMWTYPCFERVEPITGVEGQTSILDVVVKAPLLGGRDLVTFSRHQHLSWISLRATNRHERPMNSPIVLTNVEVVRLANNASRTAYLMAWQHHGVGFKTVGNETNNVWVTSLGPEALMSELGTRNSLSFDGPQRVASSISSVKLSAEPMKHNNDRMDNIDSMPMANCGFKVVRARHKPALGPTGFTKPDWLSDTVHFERKAVGVCYYANLLWEEGLQHDYTIEPLTI